MPCGCRLRNHIPHKLQKIEATTKATEIPSPLHPPPKSCSPPEIIRNMPRKVHGAVEHPGDLNSLVANPEKNEVAAAWRDAAFRKQVVAEAIGIWFFGN